MKTKKLSHRASRNKNKNTCTYLMVLCNSQREEGLVSSQICRTSNRANPQIYKINLEPIFNFLQLFYWMIYKNTSMSKGVRKIFLLRRKLRTRYENGSHTPKYMTAVETVFILIIPSSLYQHQRLDNQKRKDKDRCVRLLAYDEKEHAYCIE